jgi:predicted TIM-barrel fold metal-dependent hydrolase
MIIDAHTHIISPEIAAAKTVYLERDRWFDECYRDSKARFATAENLVASMDAAGITRSVVTGFAFADPGLCAASNDYILEAVRRFPDRFIGLAAVQPKAGDAAVYELERCLNAGLGGVGELLPDGQDFDPASPETMLPLATALQKDGAPLMIHTSEPVGHLYPGKGKTWPSKILALAANFPELKIIAAHWGGGLPFYELMPEVRLALSNLYYDTAATTYLYDFRVFRAAALAGGVSKILFASDYPLLKQERLLRRIRGEAGLTGEELDLILGRNAARLFNLTGPETNL